MTSHELVKELVGRRCWCGQKKQQKVSFCPHCYRLLPPAMRNALYKRMGEGYEAAYQAAREYLERKP